MWRVSLLVLCLSFSLAGGLSARQDDPPSLVLMGEALGELTEATPIQVWRYRPPNTDSTLVLETLSGTLDPRLRVLNPLGEVVAENADFAPDYGTLAALRLAGGGDYRVEVQADFGAGVYRLSALPLTFARGMDETFATPSPFWDIPRAQQSAGLLILTAPIAETRLFSPLNAPAVADLYFQARLRPLPNRTGAQTSVGVMVGGSARPNGQISGLRLEVDETGAWRFFENDGLGTETLFGEGLLPAWDEEGVLLGVAVEGGTALALAEGTVLARAEVSPRPASATFGLTLFDGMAEVRSVLWGTPLLPPPTLPAALEAWQGTPSAIVAELGLAAKATLGGLDFRYTVTGIDHRYFPILTEPPLRLADALIGGRVGRESGSDAACGWVARALDRDHKLFFGTDGTGGASLLAWAGGQVTLNDYISEPNTIRADENVLLWILAGRYATGYVNGRLTHRNFVPLGAGALGVGFINYAGDPATCRFESLWVWQ